MTSEAEAAQKSKDRSEGYELRKSLSLNNSNELEFAVQLGTVSRQLDKVEEAMSAFKGATTLQGSTFEPLMDIASVHEGEGNWIEAALVWERVIPLAALSGDIGKVEHAFFRAIQAAYLGNKNDLLDKLVAQCTQVCPDLLGQPKSRHLLARLLRNRNPQKAKEILFDVFAENAQDDAVAFDIASLCLQTEDYDVGVKYIEMGLDLKPFTTSFLWLAADLYDRQQRWGEVLSVCERMIALPWVSEKEIRRGFNAAIKISDFVSARRLARHHARFTGGELELVDLLRGAYERSDDLRSARLLCRWLVRRWSHSHWHIGQLISLTAATMGLPEADRLVRKYVEKHGRQAIIDRAYCQAAFAANEHLEAKRRLEWYLKESFGSTVDESANILLGYVLANAVSIDEAERHFLSIAAATYQSESALIGVAHMASRRRDLGAQVDLWRKISDLYPDNVIARVEAARALYNSGDIQETIEVCKRQLELSPSDVTMGEFFAWLLISTSNYEDALDHTKKLFEVGGPSWTALEIAIHSAGKLGSLDEEWTFIERIMPQDTSKKGGMRFYHIVRLLNHLERPDLSSRLVSKTRLEPRGLKWLKPYNDTQSVNCTPECLGPATTSWNAIRDIVSDENSQKLDKLNYEEIKNLLSLPAYKHPTVYVMNKFEQPRGGSELHAIDLANRLSKYTRVEMWAPEMPHPSFTVDHGIKGVDHSQGRTPGRGVYVFVGVYFSVRWLANTRPERIVFLYNTFEAPMLYEKIEEVFALTGVQPELLFCSDMMGIECGLSGRFEPSPIDINLFTPRQEVKSSVFTLGRHSRDVVEKHHSEDGAIYQTVSDLGGRSVILGASCMAQTFSHVQNIELRPAQNTKIVEYLHGLDLYYYRTSTWVEPWGRVVTEAMACEIPVLVHDVGGYAEIIRHEQNGILFHTTKEAKDAVKRLIKDPKLRNRLGKAGRETICSVLGDEAMDRLALFYLLR